jgi:hypothetical protein
VEKANEWLNWMKMNVGLSMSFANYKKNQNNFSMD